MPFELRGQHQYPAKYTEKRKYMNQFNNRTSVPMLFHKIYWLIWTPAQITMGTMAAWELKDSISTFTAWEMADFIYGIVTVLLMATYFTGFFKNKRYAWQALMTQLVLNMCYAVVALFMFSQSGDLPITPL